MTDHHSNTVNFRDLTLLHPNLKGYSGSCVLGEYAYLSPLMNGPGQFQGNVVRVHLNHWDKTEYCDVSNWFPMACGYVDTFADNQYVYFIPFCNKEHHGLLLRYDSTKLFNSIEAWTLVDLQALVHIQAKGFISGSIDEEYLYLAPYQSSWTQHHGLAVRYKLSSPIDNPESWSYFDMSELHPEARGYHSAVNSNNRIWFVPYVSENRVYHGHLTAFQSSNGSSFIEKDNWIHFDMTEIHPLAKGYVGGCVNQNHLYLAPYFNGIERHGLVLKYDTTMPIQSKNAWDYFDLTSLNSDLRGFFGSIVHKDHIYFLPHCKEEGVYHGTLVRYDTKMPFSSPESWSYLDTTQFDPLSKGFMGCSIVNNTLMLIPYETQSMIHSGLICFIDLDKTDFKTLRTPLA